MVLITSIKVQIPWYQLDTRYRDRYFIISNHLHITPTGYLFSLPVKYEETEA